jgi:hypothetical protein
LKPGGVFLFNTWDELKYNDASAAAQEVLNETFAENAPQFLIKAPYSMYNETEIKILVKEVGFDQVNIVKVPVSSVATSADDAAAGIIDGTPLSGQIAERNGSKEEIKRKVSEKLSANARNGELELKMQALVCSATKPA